MSDEPGTDAALEERLARVRERIAAAARAAGRDPDEITLVGVAKRQPADAVVAAVAAGLTHVAENFAQEARDKIPEVEARLRERGLAPPRWHFVGQLQRNKARNVVPIFDRVESVDRLSLATELSRRAEARGHELEVMLQVDTSGEASKGGAEPASLKTLLAEVAALPALQVVGLMTIPAAAEDPEAVRPAFARLRALRDELADAPGGAQLRELSMGMSADFEVAVAEGATHVRVGTAIFGPRPAPTGVG
ncbi:MAG: YggS family pyridoxal phosphate-dependent enzyme [Myxococcota bacterium]|nr:YggS family pyridoxal phosphate-dependent enzyme [Myxococcota bacterium]